MINQGLNSESLTITAFSAAVLRNGMCIILIFSINQVFQQRQIPAANYVQESIPGQETLVQHLKYLICIQNAD